MAYNTKNVTRDGYLDIEDDDVWNQAFNESAGEFDLLNGTNSLVSMKDDEDEWIPFDPEDPHSNKVHRDYATDETLKQYESYKNKKNMEKNTKKAAREGQNAAEDKAYQRKKEKRDAFNEKSANFISTFKNIKNEHPYDVLQILSKDLDENQKEILTEKFHRLMGAKSSLGMSNSEISKQLFYYAGHLLKISPEDLHSVDKEAFSKAK